MPRAPEKQASIESRIRSLSSMAYPEYTKALVNGTYRANRAKRNQNREVLNRIRSNITSRMTRGEVKKGTDGKTAKLNALAEMINANTNAEGDSPAIERAAAVAEASAEMLADRAIAGAGAAAATKRFKIAAPRVNIFKSTTECLVPDHVARIEAIFTALSRPDIQKDLIGLYADSQAEFSKDGKLTQEIGMSRERDLLAVLQEHLGPDLRTDIDNSLVEDCLYGTARISIKHSSGQFGSGSAKAKWCSDESIGKAYIEKMVRLDPSNYTHLMMIYIDMQESSKEKGTISIVFVTDRDIMRIVEEIKGGAFILRTGTDTRGVEYTREMIVKMIDNAAFVIKIGGVNLTGGPDPIARRRDLLHSRRAGAATNRAAAGGE